MRASSPNDYSLLTASAVIAVLIPSLSCDGQCESFTSGLAVRYHPPVASGEGSSA